MVGSFDLEVARALSLLPRVATVMTAAFEHKRGGILIDRVMACADDPPAVAISMPKGHRLATLVRDSHTFALNIIDPKDRLTIKKFESGSEFDAFELIESRSVVSGSPCLTRALACLDCDVMRHFDLEADYEMYVGLIVGAWVPSGGQMVASPTSQLATSALGARTGLPGWKSAAASNSPPRPSGGAQKGFHSTMSAGAAPLI